MRLKFSMPFSSIFYAVIVISAVLGFLTIFNALRFGQCSTWNALTLPPGRVTRLLGTIQNRLYVQTTAQPVACLKQDQWAQCLLPPYSMEPDSAPSWQVPYFGPVIQQKQIVQLIRDDHFSTVSYYSLLESGQIYTCSQSFDSEVENMLRSGSVVWLVLPAALGIWGAWALINLFIRYGSPTFWDFSGRGTKIK